MKKNINQFYIKQMNYNNKMTQVKRNLLKTVKEQKKENKNV